MLKTMKEEKELQERIERTVNIFLEQVKRALGDDCGVFIVIGSDDNEICTSALSGNSRSAHVAMSMMISHDETIRKFVKKTLAVAEQAMRMCK